MIAASGGPVRVLEIRSVRGTGGGPEKTILHSARDADPRIVATTVCYIRDQRDEIFAIDRRAATLDIDYVEVPERTSFDFSAWASVRRLVRDRQIDVVHAHEYKTDLLAWWLSHVEPIIPLSTVHGWSGESWRERRVYYPADRLLLTRFPKVIAVSTEIRDGLVRAGVRADRLTTILNAIDHRVFMRDRAREASLRSAAGFGPDDVVVGTVGRLEPGKGLEMLLDACGDIRTAVPNLRVVIAGGGSLRDALEQRARSLFADGTCVFLGHHSDIVGLHHTLDLFVHPSDHEGTPNAVLEAMALETPVVATDAGGTSELLHHAVHGLIVPCKDRAALGHAMIRALHDRSTTAARATAARRRIEQTLSFEARVRRMEALYTELVAGRRGWQNIRATQVA